MRVVADMMQGDVKAFSPTRAPCNVVGAAKMPSQRIHIQACVAIQKHGEEEPFGTLRPPKAA